MSTKHVIIADEESATVKSSDSFRLLQFAVLSRASLVAAVSFVVLFSGCLSGPGSIFDEQIGDYRNHVWANRAYNLRYGNCNRQFPEHFKQGFVDGYNDVCDGGDGYVPAVPPEEYWSHQYQSPEGAKCVNTWFRSYPLGVKAAREDGAGAFQKVYVSKMVRSAMIQENADHVLPDDVPVVAPEKESTVNLPGGPYATDPSINATPVYRSANQTYPTIK